MGSARFSAGGYAYQPIEDVEYQINALCERHRFGYRIDNGEIRRIGSPILDEVVVSPALLAVQQVGWEQAERSYRDALTHHRAGENADALTSANAAVEAALKAAGFRGSTLGDLTKDFSTRSGRPSYLAEVPRMLADLLSKLYAARSSHGDAHGKPPGAEEVPEALASLAIYWAGAFIAYLADSAP